MLVKCVEQDGVRLSLHTDEYASSPREWDNLGTMVCLHRRYTLGDEQAQNTEEYESWEQWLEGEVFKPNGGKDEVVALPLYLYDHSGITMSTGSFGHIDPQRWDWGQVGWIWATKQRLREETGYTEDELFATNPHRKPAVGEHVRVMGSLAEKGWGVVREIDGVELVVDFDANKALDFRKPENVVKVTHADVLTMVNRAEEMLREEVAVYDQYLRGEVYGFVLEKRDECPCCHNVEWDTIESVWGFYGGYEEALCDMAGNVETQYEHLFATLKEGL